MANLDSSGRTRHTGLVAGLCRSRLTRKPRRRRGESRFHDQQLGIGRAAAWGGRSELPATELVDPRAASAPVPRAAPRAGRFAPHHAEAHRKSLDATTQSASAAATTTASLVLPGNAEASGVSLSATVKDSHADVCWNDGELLRTCRRVCSWRAVRSTPIVYLRTASMTRTLRYLS